MNNSNIQKTLVDIEESLLEISSAKSQVETVAETSENLLIALKNAVGKIAEFEGGISSEVDSISESFTKQISDLNNHIEKFKTSSNNTVNIVESSFSKLKESIEGSILSAESNVKYFLEEIDNAQRKIADFDLDSNLNSLSEKVDKSKERIFQELKKYDVSNKEEMKTLQKDLSQANEILESKIQERINELEIGQKKLQNRNFLILGIGIFLLAVLMIIN